MASLAEKDKGLLKDSETERALDSFWNIPELLGGSRVVRLEAGSQSRLLPCSLLSLIVIITVNHVSVKIHAKRIRKIS